MTKETLKPGPEMLEEKDAGISNLSRRNFLGYAGASASLLLFGAACKKNDSGLDLGSGDIGILNYAFALEQLEAAFYIKVASSFYTGATTDERALLTDIRDHEVAHREFFRAALGGSAIPNLEADFSSIDFTNRTSVLATAKAFEDLGVSAYNGAGPLLQSATYLTLAGKIVSVEARHAALIRDLISNGSFVGTDVVNPANGIEYARTPNEVLAIAGTYIKTKINASNLPS
ncbi:MAG: Tat (twin-arginine translocation) pathway signal sequence containing protein [Segetibacter sp.]|nr:Tat (twin-arginine translocation) pathway signal sequence containing protein [Segetibacter sp.]